MKDKELAEEWVKEHWSKNVTELYNTESFQRVKGTPHFYDTNLREAFLAGLKAKTQWHDLRKDPTDVPNNKRDVWCNTSDGYEKGFYDKDLGYTPWVIKSSYYSHIIAWCEILTFDKE